MPIRAEPTAQQVEIAILPCIEPSVAVPFFHRDLEDLDVDEYGFRSSETSQMPAHESVPVTGSSAVVLEFAAWGGVNAPSRGKSWSTKFESSLADALSDLRETPKEARENEFELPSKAVLTNAERILKEMYQIRKMRYEVYPLENGEVAIDAPGDTNTSVFVSCEPEGSAVCIVNIDGKNQLERYNAAAELPDRFLIEGLCRIMPKRETLG